MLGRRGRLLAAGVALVVAATVAGCGSNGGSTVYSGWRYGAVAAADGSRVIVADTPSDGSDPTGPSQLWAVSRDGSKTNLGTASLPECPDAVEVDSLRSLSPGRVRAVMDCYEDPEAPAYYVTIDLAPLRFTAVATLPPHTELVAWNDGSDTGWIQQQTGDDTCTWIEPISLTAHGVTDLPSTWPHDPDTPMPAAGCARGWNAIDPGMAPGGRKVFFLAAHVTKGYTAKTWALYCFDPDSATVTKIVDGFSRTDGIDVRADQAAVVVSGVRGGDSGLWLVDTPSGRVHKVAGGLLRWPSLAPDGAAVVIDDDHDGTVKVITQSAG